MRVDEIAGPLMKLGSVLYKKYGDDASKALQKYGDDVAKAGKKADEPEIIPPGEVSKFAANPARERKTADILKGFKQFKKDGTTPADMPKPTTGEIYNAAGNDADVMMKMIKAYRRAKGLEK